MSKRLAILVVGLGVLLGLAMVVEPVAAAILDQSGLGPSGRSVLRALLVANAIAVLIWWLSRDLTPRSSVLAVVWSLTTGLLMFGIAAFDIVIGAALLFDFRVERVWMFAFVVLGAGLLVLYFDYVGSKLEKSSPEPNPELDVVNRIDPYELGAEPVPSRGAILRRWAYSILQTVLQTGLVVGGMGLGAFFFQLVRLTIYQDRRISEDRFLSAVYELAPTVGLYVVLVVGVIVVVYGIIAILEAAFSRSGAAHPEKLSRPLSTEETRWLDENFDTLLNYIEEVRYPRSFSFIYPVLGFSLMMLMMAVGALYGMVGILILAPFNDAAPADALRFGSGMLAMLLGMFSGIAGTMPVGQFIIARFPRFAEYAYVRGGWMTLSGVRRTPDQLLIGLDRAVRKGRVSPNQALEPRQYLQTAFREFAGISYRLAIIGLGFVALVSLVDQNRFRLLENDRISWSNYLDLQTHTATATEIGVVETGCYSTVNDGERKLVMKYRLITSTGQRIELGSQIKRETLSLLEQFNGNLMSAGVEFRVVERRRGRAGFDSHCTDLLQTRFGSDALRVQALLRFSESAAP